MWEKVTVVHEDIDKTIGQIDYIANLTQDEEVFEDIKTNVSRIGAKKKFLDGLEVHMDNTDFNAFMQLYSFPKQLRIVLL